MNLSDPKTCPKCEHTFSTYVAFAGHDCRRRQELAKRLRATGVEPQK